MQYYIGKPNSQSSLAQFRFLNPVVLKEPENIATCNIWKNPNLGNKLPATDKQVPLFSKKAQIRCPHFCSTQ